jgi:hypothetical protein
VEGVSVESEFTARCGRGLWGSPSPRGGCGGRG